MDNDFFDRFLRNSTNFNGGVEYFEDTHDEHGNYIGSRNSGVDFNYTTPTNNGSAQYGAQQVPQQGVYAAPQGAYTQPQGAYTQPQQTYMQPQGSYSQPQQAQPAEQNSAAEQNVAQNGARPLPTAEQSAMQLGRNFVIYRPRTTADVEQLIAYLRRGEPALVDLDPISDSPEAQRLMDFTSGAAYALGDRVITVRRNLFLITPDSMEVLKPERDD